ncbi:hypothetical protein HELRODRAFT_102065 [Helobdella robusta]|uniref:F-box domain-containing protein n=1 Tax=Helobdella robusta TaxID=6412 RepID=T1ED78_HELRO|nr:hypothetical protein HELRODRAFT_102065 [Helobdella robusta]ESN97528.1 hypothetical protein HELRODRAFT_102065 [Helobdella robusta]
MNTDEKCVVDGLFFYDVLLHIFKFLDYRSLLNCLKVCKQFNEVAKSEVLWKRLYNKHWDTIRSNDTEDRGKTSWHQQFISEYKDKWRYVDMYKEVLQAWVDIKSFYLQLSPPVIFSLRDGLTEEELDDFEKTTNVKLPNELRCVYRFHDGQVWQAAEAASNNLGLFGYLHCYDHVRNEVFLPLRRRNLNRSGDCRHLLVSESALFKLYVCLEGFKDVKFGNVVNKLHFLNADSYSVPHLVAQNFKEYFVDFANRIKTEYFPVINGMVYKFYTEPSQKLETRNITIQVHTAFLPERSYVEHYTHAYLVRFSVGPSPPLSSVDSDDGTCQLVSRHWEIADGEKVDVVDGAGVIGAYPIFKPNSKFSYVSCVVLHNLVGSMKGHFTVKNLRTNEKYQLIVPEFKMSCGFIGKQVLSC